MHVLRWMCGHTRNDAEHPTFIPMYTPTTLQTPRGHMKRPRRYTIGHKVNSLLSEPSLSTCETWLLPQMCVLCMSRNQEEGHGTATSIGQDGEDTKYKDQENKLLEVFSLRTTGQRWTFDAWALSQPEEPADRSYIGGTTGKYRTSDTSQDPDDRAPPDDRHHHTPAELAEVRRLPDVRTFLSLRTTGTHWTSNACLRTVYWTESMYPPLTPSWPMTIYTPPPPPS